MGFLFFFLDAKGSFDLTFLTRLPFHLVSFASSNRVAVWLFASKITSKKRSTLFLPMTLECCLGKQSSQIETFFLFSFFADFFA